jgi:hypothetical protein
VKHNVAAAEAVDVLTRYILDLPYEIVKPAEANDVAVFRKFLVAVAAAVVVAYFQQLLAMACSEMLSIPLLRLHKFRRKVGREQRGQRLTKKG